MDIETLYKEHYDKVYRTAMAFLKDREDAYDATQDTFLKAHNALDTYDGTSAVSTWLVNICINTCKDELRKRKRENKLIYSDNAPELTAVMEAKLEDIASPLAVMEAEESESALNTMFLSLPDNLYRAVILRFLDDLSYKELAEELGVNINTAKTWVRRGRKQLMQAISPQ